MICLQYKSVFSKLFNNLIWIWFLFNKKKIHNQDSRDWNERKRKNNLIRGARDGRWWQRSKVGERRVMWGEWEGVRVAEWERREMWGLAAEWNGIRGFFFFLTFIYIWGYFGIFTLKRVGFRPGMDKIRTRPGPIIYRAG